MPRCETGLAMPREIGLAIPLGTVVDHSCTNAKVSGVGEGAHLGERCKEESRKKGNGGPNSCSRNNTRENLTDVKLSPNTLHPDAAQVGQN